MVRVRYPGSDFYQEATIQQRFEDDASVLFEDGTWAQVEYKDIAGEPVYKVGDF